MLNDFVCLSNLSVLESLTMNSHMKTQLCENVFGCLEKYEIFEDAIRVEEIKVSNKTDT